MIRGLRFIRLEVEDLDRSLAFYLRGLRFVAASRDGAWSEASSPTMPGQSDGRPEETPRERSACLTAGSLCLILAEVAPDKGSALPGRGVDLAIEVAGVDVYHDALVARGIHPSPPRDRAGLRSFSVRDPDGYRWRIQQSLD